MLAQNTRPVSRLRTNRFFPYFMLSPYFLVYLTFSFFPVIFTLVVSFNNWSGANTPVFAGFRNYTVLLNDTRFWSALRNTGVFVLFLVPLQTMVGLIIANIVSNERIRGRNVLRLATFLPYLTAGLAVGIVYSTLFDWQHGTINMVLKGLNLIDKNIYWKGVPWASRLMIIMVLVWKNSGYTALFFAAGITSIDRELFDAASIDGAGGIRRFFSITIPQLRPVLNFVVLTTLIGSFQLFDELEMLFREGRAEPLVGGPANSCLTLVWMMRDTGFRHIPAYGYAAAVSYGLFVVIVLCTLITNKVLFGKRGEL